MTSNLVLKLIHYLKILKKLLEKNFLYWRNYIWEDITNSLDGDQK